MPYIVIERRADGTEQAHAKKNGNLTMFGKPHKFLSKERAREIAQAWAEVHANCGKTHKMIVRKVD